MRLNSLKFLYICIAVVTPLHLSASAKTVTSQQIKATTKTKQTTLSKNKSLNSYKFNFVSKISGYTEGEDSSTNVLFGFSPELEFKFNSIFNVKTKATLNLSSSRTQSRYQPASDKEIVLNELSLNLTPMKNILISAGALNQSHLNAPYLVSGFTFPGVLAKWQIKRKKINFGVKAQSLIPTSSSFAADRTEKEALPSLQTQGVFANYSATNWLNLNAQINYFKFSSLPSIVAYESKRLGNSVSGLDSSNSFFENNYSGITQSYVAKVIYSEKLQQKINLSITENENVSKGNNRAQIIGSSLLLNFSKFNIEPGISSFFAETDASPAYYNSSSLGHNNRSGIKYSLKTLIKNMGLSFQINYIDSKVINASAFQQDLIFMEFFVGMINVKF